MLLVSDLKGSSNGTQTAKVLQDELCGRSQSRRQVRRRKGRGHTAEEQDCWVQCDNVECAKWRRIPKSHMKYANPRGLHAQDNVAIYSSQYNTRPNLAGQQCNTNVTTLSANNCSTCSRVYSPFGRYMTYSHYLLYKTLHNTDIVYVMHYIYRTASSELKQMCT